MIALNTNQIASMNRALDAFDGSDLDFYLDIRELMCRKQREYKSNVRKMFTKYYKLNNARLSNAFKDAFFKELFSYENKGSADPYTKILRKLHKVEERSLQCSFVSKLVSLHEEKSPIFDNHVGNFFGMKVVPKPISVEYRISAFVQIMEVLRDTYSAWVNDPQIVQMLDHFKEEYPKSSQCADSRLIDFLVWTVGKKNLYG